jgi:hypothetical protein
MMAGNLLDTDRITEKHSVELIERATKEGVDQIRCTQAGRTVVGR